MNRSPYCRLFALLAAVMVGTRRLDWYALTAKA